MQLLDWRKARAIPSDFLLRRMHKPHARLTRKTWQNLKCSRSAAFSVIFFISVWTVPPSIAAEPADFDNAIRDLTQKLTVPTLSARERSELYRRRANEYLKAFGSDGACRGRALAGVGQKAVEDLEAAVRLDPANAEAYFELGNQSYNEARARGDNDKGLDVAAKRSLADYAMALRIGVSSAKARSEIYADRALMEVPRDTGADQDAIEAAWQAELADYNAAIQADSHNGDLFFVRGLLYDSLNRVIGMDKGTLGTKELADYSAALSLPRQFSGTCAIYMWRANVYEDDKQAEDYTSAIKFANTPGSTASCWTVIPGPTYGVTIYCGKPTNIYDLGDAYLNRARWYDALKKPELAIADYSFLISEKPKVLVDTYDIRDVYLARANDYDQIGQHDKAASDRRAGAGGSAAGPQ